MVQPASTEKIAALNALYKRIALIAAAMGGRTSEEFINLAMPGAMVESPRAEAAPSLVVEMPGSFRVEFAPSHPVSIGNALFVRVVRTHENLRKTDWQFNLGPDGWRRTQTALSDEEIRQCLTVEGPKPAIY